MTSLDSFSRRIRIVTGFVLGAWALAFGLAFGLGTRDIVRNIIVGSYTRKYFSIGQRLEVAGQSGFNRHHREAYDRLTAMDTMS
jgi:small-conductance mechanosensitive channel